MSRDNLTPEQFLALAEANELQDLDTKLQQIKLTAEAVQRLKEKGFQLYYHPDCRTAVSLKTTKKDLPKIRKAVGAPLYKAWTTPITDTKVEVNLKCKAAPFLYIEYEDTIKPGGRCQIIAEYTKNMKLVCRA